MKLIFLASTHDDLRWFHKYYSRVFPAGKSKADKQFLSMKKAVLDNPLIGHKSENYTGVREFPISNTPFTLVYRVTDKEIQVLRLKDQRSAKL